MMVVIIVFLAVAGEQEQYLLPLPLSINSVSELLFFIWALSEMTS